MKKIRILFSVLFLCTKVFSQNGNTNKPGPEEESLDPVYFEYSNMFNQCGDELVFDLSAQELWDLNSVNVIDNGSLYSSQEFERYVIPEILREEVPNFNFQDIINGTIPQLNFNYLGINFIKEGDYTAWYCGKGTLLLPQKSYDNVSKIVIVENYQIYEEQNPFNGLKYKVVYNYFFADELQNIPIMYYAEKTKSTFSESFSEVYYEINLGEDKLTGDLDKMIDLNCSPNPASNATSISFIIPKEGRVQLYIESALNNLHVTILDNYRPQGNNNIDFNTSNLIPGIYLVRLQYDGKLFSRKLIIN